MNRNYLLLVAAIVFGTCVIGWLASDRGDGTPEPIDAKEQVRQKMRELVQLEERGPRTGLGETEDLIERAEHFKRLSEMTAEIQKMIEELPPEEN